MVLYTNNRTARDYAMFNAGYKYLIIIGITAATRRANIPILQRIAINLYALETMKFHKDVDSIINTK